MSGRTVGRPCPDAEPLRIAPTRVVTGPATAGGVFVPLRVARWVLTASFERWLLGQDRASQRHRPSLLEGDGIRDVGRTRVEAELETRKPFWRA